ncbi:hypothetical protein CIK05_01435 [Bdellovibrio sp. qaytius]|nr:hypothetical protein CIK05_01435 [Bdellovibrio sp. qaytius]
MTITVAVISFLLLLEVIGVGLASRNTLAGLTDMHQTIRVVNQVRNLRQVISTRTQFLKEFARDDVASPEESVILDKVEKQMDDLFATCLELSASHKQVNALILDAQKSLLEERALSRKMLTDPNTHFEPLIIDQFVLEAQDSLGKVQLVLSAQSDELFDKIFKARFLPLMVAVSLAIIFLLFAFFMAYRLRKQIEAPIQNLIQSTKQLAEGNLKTRARIYDVDEIGLLAHAFNVMAANLEQSTVSRGYIESILESMFNCVLVLDDKGTILTVNRLTVQTFGYSKTELIGLSMSEILREDVSLIETNSNVETEASTRSGQKFPVLISVATLDEQARMPSNLRVCVIKDISESKRLEGEIKERNLALSAANQELEAFSYSVSHDLRAPLRIIDGFSQALVEDAGDQLHGEAKVHLDRIRAGVQRMGQLIDAVLNLSRLTRAAMTVVDLDFTAMGKVIIAELHNLEPGRKVEVFIQEDMHGNGDLVLMKVTLENLLGNAWKYTSKKEVAKIEFGTTMQNGLEVFFVKDNGAGFDMNYAKKLFTPFQRLHTQSEFSGTGIGLASVKRILHRHGGTIWVDSVVNEGTTFYFTLGAAQA